MTSNNVNISFPKHTQVGSFENMYQSVRFVIERYELMRSGEHTHEFSIEATAAYYEVEAWQVEEIIRRYYDVESLELPYEPTPVNVVSTKQRT
jgi:hypothetical protein